MAEYRAYQLSIKNETTGKEITVISTLDHLQYPTYHPLEKGDTIEYIDSWMCWEDSDFHRPICNNSSRQPASNADLKPNSPNLTP